MSDSNDLVYFSTPEDFNEKASFLCDNPYGEYEKFKNYFELNFKANGPNSFAPTMAVFSFLKNFVGMVTCREAKDKNDLFKAMSQMLFLPMSIGSNLFIIATDVNVTESADSSVSDALVTSFVTSDACLIFTVPYSYNQSNDITWHEDKAFITNVMNKIDDNSPVGDLVELFYVYSHAESTGPFNHEEVLLFLENSGFVFEIFNKDKINDMNVISIPFKQR